MIGCQKPLQREARLGLVEEELGAGGMSSLHSGILHANILTLERNACEAQMIGKKISHYKILEKLGEGGMSSFSKKCNNLVPQAGGVVYKAEDTKLKRIVAIKFLPRQIAASADEGYRFKIEAQPIKLWRIIKA